MFLPIVIKKLQNKRAPKPLAIADIAENSPVLSMRSAIYGPAHLSLASNSFISFPAIVSHDYSVISLALNNIFVLKKWAFDACTLLSLVLTRDSNYVIQPTGKSIQHK